MPTNSVVTEVSSNVVQRIYVDDPSDTSGDKYKNNFLLPVVHGIDKLFTPAEAAGDTAAKRRTTFFGLYRHALGDTGIGKIGKTAPCPRTSSCASIARRPSRSSRTRPGTP
jgi:hypothetical protein